MISQLPDQEREKERGKTSEGKSDLTGARKGEREREREGRGQKIIYIKLCGARWEMISGTLILKLLPVGAATPEHQRRNIKTV